jgi:hypothetical protein
MSDYNLVSEMKLKNFKLYLLLTAIKEDINEFGKIKQQKRETILTKNTNITKGTYFQMLQKNQTSFKQLTNL